MASQILTSNTKIVDPKHKQGVYGAKDYIYNLELSTASIDPKFGVASHFIISCYGKTDIEIKPSIRTSKKALLSTLLSLKRLKLCAVNMNLWIIS